MKRLLLPVALSPLPRRLFNLSPLLSPRLLRKDPSLQFRETIKVLSRVSLDKKVPEVAAVEEAVPEVAVEVAEKEEKVAREEKAAKASVVDAVAEVAAAVAPELRVRRDPELREVRTVVAAEDLPELRVVKVTRVLPMFKERRELTSRAKLTISKAREESNGTHSTERTVLAEAEVLLSTVTVRATSVLSRMRLDRVRRFLKLRLKRLPLLKNPRLRMSPLRRLPFLPLKLSRRKRRNQLRTI
jgi:hypothetical protein